MLFAQNDFGIRFDWGIEGARVLSRATPADSIFVVVDVLSFTTAVSVACDAGIEVFPFRWRDERATEFAAQADAVLAQRRSSGGVSLSPASIRAACGLKRLVLPSPNGATITTFLQGCGATVVAASLRNALAVGRWISRNLADRSVVVIASGEYWPTGPMRPAVEDHWGAGAVIAEILRSESLAPSPEAQTAAAAYYAAAENIAQNLTACAGGQELIQFGYGADVAIAAEINASAVVPVLEEGRYRSARR